MDTQKCTDSLLELIRRTSCFLPPDVQNMLELKRKLEKKNSRAEFAMDLVMQNTGLAKRYSLPICQDTGLLTFYVKHPAGIDARAIITAAEAAVVQATQKGYLRQNSVDSLSGKNSGTNLGPGSPAFHFETWDKPDIEFRLVQKGGGCENMSAQYALPAVIGGKKFGRDLAGVRACILDAVNKAQGKGCSPGFLGVCVGGDRATGFEWAKHQLLRETDDMNPVPELAELEAKVLDECNRLNIGPMGFGGKLTVGACKIGVRNRLPASFYVTIAYMCWAYRRRGVVLNSSLEPVKWLYEAPGEFSGKAVYPDKFSIDASKAVNLYTPLTEEAVRSLKVGDVVLLSGRIYTGRDAVHKYLSEGGELDLIKNGIIYHCGPVMLKEGGAYRSVAAGPTTSIREEPYQAGVIEKFGIKAVIGKGGMGGKTLEACKKFGAVYLHGIGGAAQIYAQCIKRVPAVHLEQFGSPEAVWELEVEGFPAVVTMDSHGNSLHQEVQDGSEKVFKGLV